MATDRRSVRKQREGIVVSDAMDKTIVVQVERRFPHPTYGKVIRRHRKLYAHDERNEARRGDVVRIEEVRPLSRLKRWRLLEVVRRGKAAARGSQDDRAEDQS